MFVMKWFYTIQEVEGEVQEDLLDYGMTKFIKIKVLK
jgi:hypothetical protein